MPPEWANQLTPAGLEEAVNEGPVGRREAQQRPQPPAWAWPSRQAPVLQGTKPPQPPKSAGSKCALSPVSVRGPQLWALHVAF